MKVVFAAGISTIFFFAAAALAECKHDVEGCPHYVHKCGPECEPVKCPHDANSLWQPISSRWLFEIGPEVFHHEYKEPGFMKEKGWMYGIAWGLTYRNWVPDFNEPLGSKWMFRAEGDVAWGQVDYDGGLQDLSGNTVAPFTMDDVDDWLTEIRFLIGPDFPRKRGVETLYTGFGYRYLNDDSSDNVFGYERESNYFYLPVGLKTTNYLKNGWSIGASGEFDLLLWGIQRSHLEDVGFEEIDNDQHEGYGLRAAITLAKKTEGVGFKIEPFIRYWNIDDSDESTAGGLTGIEPHNKTTEIGVQFALLF